MRTCVLLTSFAGALALQAADGTWARRSYQGTTAWNTAANWVDSAVPGGAGDTARLKTVFDRTNDAESWGVTMRIALPATADEPDGTFSLGAVSGYGHFALSSPAGWKGNRYDLGDLTDYSGALTMGGGATLVLPARADGGANAVRRLNVERAATLEVPDGVARLDQLGGVGTVTKTGAGELLLDGVSAAMGVNLRVDAGRVTLNGHPAVADVEPVAGAAFWVDASKAESLTLDAGGRVSAIADARGGDHPVATRYRGNNAQLVPFADKQLLNCGAYYKSGYAADEVARYGDAGAFQLPAEIADVKSFFVVYRYNKPAGGTPVFPFADAQGYTLRPGTTGGVGTGVVYPDGTDTPLFQYVQYGSAYQCYSPHRLLAGDIRRGGEDIVYKTAPRGYGEALDLISAVTEEEGSYAGGACPSLGLKCLAGNHNEGVFGGVQIAELVAYTRCLTPAEQRRNISYLQAKWMKHVGVRDWDVGVLTPNGGEVHVPAGRTACVKTLDLSEGPLVKTGGGRLAVRYIRGGHGVRVEDGTFDVLPGLAPDVTVPEAVPAYGKLAHLDANAADTLVFADGSATAVTGWTTATPGLAYAAGTVSSAGTSAADGLPTVVTDDRGMKWVDFGATGWMYFKTGSADTAKPLGGNTFQECFAVIRRRADATHGPNVFGSYNPWNRYCPAGATTMLGGNPYGNPSTDGNADGYYRTLTAQWALNGRRVDPARENYGDGVQVVRVSTATPGYFNAIGCDNASGKGGLLVGEIICYGRALTDRERVETERYLLKKWKGVAHPDDLAETDALPAITYGTGAASALDVAADVSVGTVATPSTTFVKTGPGSLSVGVLPAEVDTLSVTEGALAVGAYSRAAPAAVRTAMDTLQTCVHLDASARDTLTVSPDGAVARIADVDGRDIFAAPYSGTYGTRLAPTLVENFANGLPAIDMGPVRLQAASAVLALPAQKATKSFYLVYRRYDGVYNTIAGPLGFNSEWKTGGATSIFDPSISANYVTHATLTVDGAVVGNADGGYPEGLHVFGMRNKNYDWASFSLGTFGGNLNEGGGMYVCELIAGTKDARGNAAEGKLIEDYLYEKWIAPKHVGYRALTLGADASLSLQGDVALQDGAALSFGMDADGRIGAVVVTGTLTLAGGGTVTLALPAGLTPAKGVHPILTAGALADGTAAALKDWTLDAPSVPGRKFRLVAEDGRICLAVEGLGLTILVK